MKVRVLEQRHPDYDEGELSRCRALYEGGKAWREQISEWLPKHSHEMPDTLGERHKLATYENHAGPILDLLAGALFAEAPAVEDLRGAWVETFLGNVDHDRTPFSLWFRRALLDALVGRRVYAWVNLPARGEGVAFASRLEEEQAGALDAFLVELRAEQVINWEVDERGRLLWLMVRDVVQRQASPTEPRKPVHRWTAIDAATIRRWEWTPEQGDPRTEPDADDEAREASAIQHGLGELPVVDLCLPDGLWAMGKLHDPAVAHLRARNDLTWGLHRGAHALMYIKSKWDDASPILGAGYYLKLGLEDDIGYAEPSGAMFTLLADDVTRLREAIYRVVHQMAVGADSTATRSSMSAESKAEDWRATEIVLSAYAELARPFIAETLRLVTKARGAEQRVVIKGLDGWAEEDVAGWLEAAAMATDAHRMSETFAKAVAKRQAQRVLQGADPAVLVQVEKEIDGALWDPAPYLPPPPGGGSGSGDPGDDDGEG